MKDISNTKISVIMPVLNGMPYFKNALDSVRKQTLQDIEILVVDAGSSDGTCEYIKECALTDRRIRLLCSDRKSMGAQYNLGISKAKGDYLAFCESDDYLDLHMLNDLYAKAEQRNYPDCIKANFKMFIDRSGKEFSVVYEIIPSKCGELYDKEISTADYMGLIWRDMNMWNGIYRRGFIEENDIVLNETPGASFQDAGFVQQVNLLAKRQVYVRESYYHYRRDNEGASVYSKERSKFALQECEYAIKWIGSRRDLKRKYGAIAIMRLLSMFVGLYIEDIFKYKKMSYDSSLDLFQKEVLDFIQDFSNSDRIALEDNLFFWLFLRDINTFKKLAIAQGEKDAWTWNVFKELVRSNDEIVIVTCGDVGIGLYSLLVRNKWNGKAIFCDNNKSKQGTKVAGIPVYSLEQATTDYSDALYLVNPLLYDELNKQLEMSSIDRERIIKAPFVSTHTSMEIDLDKFGTVE